jgi:hypothetical protein
MEFRVAENIEVLDKNNQKVESNSLTDGLFFVERFYNRNKKKVIFLGAVLVFGGIFYIADEMLKDYRKDVANNAYYNYKNGIEVEANFKIVEDLNPKLANLILFSKAVENGDKEKLEIYAKSSDSIIADLSEYQLHSLNKNSSKLNEYSYKEGSIYRDLAIISEAFALINDGKMSEAQNRLSFVENGSTLRDLANYLNHFGAVSKSYDASSNQFMRDDLNSNGAVSQ